MSIVIKVEGGEKVISNMQFFTEEMKLELDRIIMREALRIEGEAKAYSPIDTGRLRSSIHSRKLEDLLYMVGDGVHYGIYQEFGTSKMPAHPFMMPAVYSSLPQFEAELSTLISRIPKV